MKLSDLGISKQTYDMNLKNVYLRNKKEKKLHDQFLELLVKVGPIGVHSTAGSFQTSHALASERPHGRD